MEGDIKCIFYSEFHNIYGTKIIHQYPEGFISNDIFDGFAEYIIPKPKLCGKVIALTAFNFKILGFPVLLQDVKYHRNALLFNLCLVFDKSTDTTPYHPIVRKLGTILRTLETESEYLFNQSKDRDQPDLLKILETLYMELNSYGESTITVDDANTINVKLFRKPTDIIDVQLHQVPVLIDEIDTTNSSEWDLTLLQILPYIDGVNYVGRISKLTEIDNNLVISCIQHLVKLASNLEMQRECQKYISLQSSNSTSTIIGSGGGGGGSTNSTTTFGGGISAAMAAATTTTPLCSFEYIFSLYAGLSVDTPFREYCTENNLTGNGIDERSFIMFGVINGILRRKHRYPIISNLQSIENLMPTDKKRLLNGNKSFDEICCILSVGVDAVESLLNEIAKPDSYQIIWK
eukprot:gene7829-9643_t